MWIYRVAALGSDVWQKRNRSSLRPFPKAYLLAILQLSFSSLASFKLNWQKLQNNQAQRVEGSALVNDEVKATGQSNPA